MKLHQDTTTGLLKIAGDVGILQIDELHDALRNSLAENNGIKLDLGSISSCDASALQTLVCAKKTAASLRKPFIVTDTSDALMQSLLTLGLSLESAAAQPSGAPNT